MLRCQFDKSENYEICREFLSGKFCLVKVLQMSWFAFDYRGISRWSRRENWSACLSDCNYGQLHACRACKITSKYFINVPFAPVELLTAHQERKCDPMLRLEFAETFFSNLNLKIVIMSVLMSWELNFNILSFRFVDVFRCNCFNISSWTTLSIICSITIWAHNLWCCRNQEIFVK